MKITCEIIKDLLPIYIDDLCSDDSKTAVEEHIAVCDSCRLELQTMQLSIPVNNKEQNLNEAAVVKMLSKEWKKSKWKSLFKGIIYTLIAVAIIMLFLIFSADFSLLLS